MEAKALVLAAAFGWPAISTSIAQVYSVNAVGYVNVSIPANGWAALGNPLNGPTNNSLDNILPIPSGFTAVIYRFDPVVQAYLAQIDWVEGFGWFSADDPDPTINPGEGFFLQNGAPNPLNITWIGEVPSGTLHNAIPGGNRWSIRSSVLPKAGRLEDLGFPPCAGDNVYIFDSGCQCYLDSYAYVGGFGWYSPSDPDPKGPYIAVGAGFFLQRAGCPSTDWVQSFSVGP